MRSSRGKAPLRMTPAVSDEILTPLKAEGARGRMKKELKDNIKN